jgi:hypothetical protein
MTKAFSALLFLILFSSGTPTKMVKHKVGISQINIVPDPPDYSDNFYWVAHPSKWDYSDSIPSFLIDNSCDTSADIFFLHPTTYIYGVINSSLNADLHDATVNKQTDREMMYQVSVFNHNCRVFAPRYRQAHLKAYFRYKSDASKQAFDLAYKDLKNAFQYYLDHWNHGRPIIIASHSQGSMHAIRLLQEFFDGKLLQKQLVCAYVVGWQIKKGDFKKIPFGNSPSQTGCVVGWRTYKKDHIDPLVKRENGNSLCVNPISWTIDNKWTPREMHKGAVGKNFNKLVSNRISAAVAPGANILWVDDTQGIDGTTGMSMLNNYHIADYNLFWMDIRENVKLRIKEFVRNSQNSK